MIQPRSRATRRGLIWAVAGGLIVIGAVVAIVVSSMMAQVPTADPTPTGSSGAASTPHDTAAPAGKFVDPAVIERGWVPEPITPDPDVYVRAALAAASTFDTQLSTRQEWLAYLDTWFTPDTRYASEQDREDDMRAAQLELRQGVVLPEEEWKSLANEDGRVTATVPGEISYQLVPDDASGDMRIGTADVVLTYTRADGAGTQSPYDETVRVSIQVLCGAGSIPTPDSAQQPGDCKVVRYFSGSLEG
ncbi:hypothetical protein [Microbacterium sp. CFBP9034]|uniref:hypothetical protein n=1 Tax=Microbacterium sp. CFBP9034 TaxID=3096540 RepID=UPI002A6A465D|nr:hypothetical protein [Microbacterium sp. CFBP9034]MDY0910107.1 hypothetical protein [Microbacterium sp. CFBP9034]